MDDERVYARSRVGRFVSRFQSLPEVDDLAADPFAGVVGFGEQPLPVDLGSLMASLPVQDRPADIRSNPVIPLSAPSDGLAPGFLPVGELGVDASTAGLSDHKAYVRPDGQIVFRTWGLREVHVPQPVQLYPAEFCFSIRSYGSSTEVAYLGFDTTDGFCVVSQSFSAGGDREGSPVVVPYRSGKSAWRALLKHSR
jgi:hypothetical protein